MRKLNVCLITFAVLVASRALGVDRFYHLNDGKSHTIADGRYSTSDNDLIYLDEFIYRTPGTHLNFFHGGVVDVLKGYGNSTINMYGGEIKRYLQAKDNGCINVFGGAIGTGPDVFGLSVRHQAVMNVYGGNLCEKMFTASVDGKIYLHGSNFEVNGQRLKEGDKLSDFGELIEYRPHIYFRDYYTGTVTGTLADGSVINSVFRISNLGDNKGSADIIIVPEPCSVLLLGLGSIVFLRRRRLG